MRVITGSAKGTILKTQEGKEKVRPTTDRVKEGIFSSIQFELVEAKILDLFAGSGQLGIEALSRGAAHCVFIDHDMVNQEIIKENLKKSKLFSKGRVSLQDGVQYIKYCKDTFDFIFLDPPYKSDDLNQVLERIVTIMNKDCKIICEIARGEEIQYPKELEEISRKKYGNTMIIQLKMRG